MHTHSLSPSVCTSVHPSVCLCVCVCVCVCTRICKPKLHIRFLLSCYPLYFLSQDLWLKCYCVYGGWPASLQALPVSILSAIASGFLHGSRDPNSSSQACVVSTLPFGLCPWPLKSSNFANILEHFYLRMFYSILLCSEMELSLEHNVLA